MLSTQLNTFKNTWYKPGAKWKIIIWYICNWLFFKSTWNVSYGFKVFILRLFGAKVGKGVVIKQCVNIKYPWLLIIGDHVWIAENVWIDNLALVTIKNNTCISQGAMLLCGNHNYKKTNFDLIVLPITLDEGVWIGAKAIVCPGVHAHSHAILTVGSIAIQNLDAYSLYQGNPAIFIRKRDIKV